MCFHFYFLFIGEPIAMADLEDVLDNMGVELTNKEFRKLVKKLQADGKCLK